MIGKLRSEAAPQVMMALGGVAPGEGAMEESEAWIRGSCRLGKVHGGSLPGDGIMVELRCWLGLVRGRCRLGQVQGGLAPGEGTMEEPGGRSRER